MQLHIYSPQSDEAITCGLDALPITMGRSEACDLQLPFAIVSGLHLRLSLDEGGQHYVEDMGSTNGTTVNGERLLANQPTPVHHNTTLAILDLRIVIDLSRASRDGFTLAERDTFVRQMVSQAIRQESDGEDLAFFEIIRGEKRGHRVFLPDTLSEGWIGQGEQIHFSLTETSPERVAMIVRDGDGFVLHPQPEALVEVDGVSIHGPTVLRSRQRILLHQTECIFFDPLQDYLEELEGKIPDHLDVPLELQEQLAKTPQIRPRVDPSDVSDERNAPQPVSKPVPTQKVNVQVPAPPVQGLSGVEIGLLVMTVLFIVGGVMILLIVFGVVSI